MQSRTAADAPHIAYRKDIDGLRAIAVLSVLLFHAFPGMLIDAGSKSVVNFNASFVRHHVKFLDALLEPASDLPAGKRQRV